MTDMFYNATSFNQPIGNWNTSNVTTMQQLFYQASSFNQPLYWDVRNVTNMLGVFYYATAFNGDITSWQPSSATTMNFMFDNATHFNQNINSWGANTANVTTMVNMFYNANSFNQPLNSWDVHNVTSMGDMFNRASSFNGDISSWNTGFVKNMVHMFFMASSFNQNISSWNTDSVTDMAQMFGDASSFNQNLSDWNVEKVTNMKGMFDYSGMQYCNVDTTIIGWASQNVQSNVTMGAYRYSDYSLPARNLLTTSKNWTITGTDKTLFLSPKIDSVCWGTQIKIVSNGGTGSHSWNTGSNASSITVTPNSTINEYTVADGCVVDTAKIYLPPVSGNLADDGESATCEVSGYNPIHFFNLTTGNYIGSINPEGATGEITMTAYVGPADTVHDCAHPTDNWYTTAFMGRRFLVKQNIPLTGNYNHRQIYLPFSDSEFADLVSKSASTPNPQDNVSTLSDLYTTKFDGAVQDSTAHDNCNAGAEYLVAQDISGSVSAYLPPVSGEYARFSVSSFSEFYLHGLNYGTPLATNLIDFKAQKDEKDVAVSWKVMDALQYSSFEVQRSTDNNPNQFTTFATVQSKQQIAQDYIYSALDNDPANGTNYYRLKMIENDGKIDYSQVDAVNFNSSFSIRVFPNPSSGNFNVQFYSVQSRSYQFTIFNALGKK